MSSAESGSGERGRAECPIVRTHQRFLLKRLEFTQQYASMYRCRIEMQYNCVLHSLRRSLTARMGPGASAAATATPVRVLEFSTGVPAVCVGVLYKQMRLLPRFLDEYQKELVRIDAGDDEGDEEGDDAMALDDSAVRDTGAASPVGVEDSDRTLAAAATNEHYSVCHDDDELLLEDSSGRVLLCGLQERYFCTGVVLGVYGVLNPTGELLVHDYAFADITERFVPRSPVPLCPPQEPCYMAFVCDLRLSGAELLEGATNDDGESSRTLVELLIQFIQGGMEGEALTVSSRISRLIVGGNSIAPTEDQRLKRKVKLDPQDHARLHSSAARRTTTAPLNGASSNSNISNTGSTATVTSAKLMQDMDRVLAQLSGSVEVELMPGDTDMSDAFFPQQPIHPVLLPTAARQSSLRLVSNPFEFTTVASGGMEDEEAKTDKATRDVSFFVTSGQNVNDVARETQFDRRINAMAMMLQSGCSCPTAPNTLFSYPFRDTDPFLFEHIPHCFVACDQPCYESRLVDLATLRDETSGFITSAEVEERNKENMKLQTPEENDSCVRLLAVPSFHRTGQIVLVDVNSPTLETSVVDFSMQRPS